MLHISKRLFVLVVLDISSQTVLITGAAKRIGKAIALSFAAKKWSVAVHYNTSKDKAEKLAREINSSGGKAIAVKGDLSKHEEIPAVISQTNDAFGEIGCLVNNASTFICDSVKTATYESWIENLHVNLLAPFFLSQQFASQLSDDSHGAIINLIDQRVLNLTPNYSSYTVSKSGLWTLTQTMAQALAPNIRVNAIAPGFVLPVNEHDKEKFEKLCAATPLQQKTQVQEICRTVDYILETPSMTGQIIAIDGGKHLGWK